MSLLKYTTLLATLLLPFARSQGSCRSQTIDKFTFFGFPDANSALPSFPCSQDPLDGGDGSYERPESFATALSNKDFNNCEVIYIPYFKKYFQYHDHCQTCEDEFNGQGAAQGYVHLDLWMGPQNLVEGQLDCEMHWATLTGKDILRNPPQNLDTVTSPLTSQCSNTAPGLTFPDDQASCSGGGGGAGSSNTTEANTSNPPASSPPAAAPPISTPAVQPQPLAEGNTKNLVDDKKVDNSAPAAAAPAANLPTGPANSGFGIDRLVADRKQAGGSPTTLQTVVVPSSPPPPPSPTSSSSSVAAAAAGDTQPTPSSGGSSGGSKKQIDWSGRKSYWEQIKAQEANCASWNACLGATCSSYNDCAGEWICVAGKCTDQMKD